jgi:hypothetical protein
MRWFTVDRRFTIDHLAIHDARAGSADEVVALEQVLAVERARPAHSG